MIRKFTCDVGVLKQTDKAVLVDVEGDEIWIPKSQIDEDSEIGVSSEEGDEGQLVIPEWLAIEKGLM